MKMLTVIIVLGCILGGCGVDPTCDCTINETTSEDLFKIIYTECYDYCHTLTDFKEQCGDFADDPIECVRELWYEGWTLHNCAEKLVEINEKIAKDDCTY